LRRANWQSILEKGPQIAEIYGATIRLTQKESMNELIFLIEEAPEGGYTARALGHSIFTEAESIEVLREQIRDATKCHFEEGQSPKIIRLHFVREEVIAG
jgi:hypothetical protein